MNNLPARTGGPAPEWPHRDLYDRVIKALHALPWDFDTNINISGIRVTDLHTFNSALGAAIEQSVVENLNKLRSVWDPDETYRLYRFHRQSQVFPDVILKSIEPDAKDSILMGIELKGWFAMAKEGEPSFRYTVTSAACADADLLVVFPWILREVVSGSPMLLPPFVEEARFAAEMRNAHWRSISGDSSVQAAAEVAPYPSTKAAINDRALNDSSGNFGRVSRSGLMKDFNASLMEQPVSGIPLGAWQKFIKIFAEGATDQIVDRRIQSLKSELQVGAPPELEAALNQLEDSLRAIFASRP